MSSIVSIIDTSNNYSVSDKLFKVIITSHEDESVVLNGKSAADYLSKTLLSGFMNNSSVSTDSGILPPGVRAVGSNYIVFERPPCYQNVFFNKDKVHSEMSDDDITLFRIPVPWQVYIVVFDTNYYVSQVGMYFSPTSLTSINQPLYLAPLPNFYTDGSLCRPMFSNIEEIERYPKNLSGVISCAYDWIWNNGTNNDLNEAVVQISLQIASKGLKEYESTVYNKISTDDYTQKFSTSHHPSYYHYTQVTSTLKAWEMSTLEEVIGYTWPSPSLEKHFHNSVYSSHDENDIRENSSFYNWLTEWAVEYYSDESDIEVETRIDNGEFDEEEYYHYVVNNYIKPSKTSFQELSFSTVLNNYITNIGQVNIKSTFNNYVNKAFEDLRVNK
jgi:hypothetical protein